MQAGKVKRSRMTSETVNRLNSYIVLGVFIKSKYLVRDGSSAELTCPLFAAVDPNSARADELRKLLDVVAGQAMDEAGRISEPIVKDEMAIVDFLTAKANNTAGSNVRNSAPFPPYSHILPIQKPLQPSKQMRQEPSPLRGRSDSIEQKPAINRQGSQASDWSGGDPAWSFVAPGMAQIDVHHPFAQQPQSSNALNNSPNQRMPRPLRPPQSGRQRSDSRNSGNESPPTNLLSAPSTLGYQPSYTQSPPQPQGSPLRHQESLLRTAFGNGSTSNVSEAMPSGHGLAEQAYTNADMHSFGQSQDDPSLNLFSDPWLDSAYAMLGIGSESNTGRAPGDGEFNPFELSQFGQSGTDNRDSE